MPTLERKWSPHPAQRVIMADDARFRICACGRRFGKTEMCHHDAFDFAFNNPGVYIWWVAPTYEDANELGYEPLESMIPEKFIADRRKKEPRYLRLTNGSEFSFRTSDRESSLRGRGLDLLVIDEAGEVPDNIWQEALRPTLSDTLGDMIAIGTPKGRNWFHDWFLRGNDPESANTSSYRFSTYDNPHVKDSEVEDARKELPERVFKQEYCAKFLTDDGSVFGPVKERNAVGYSLETAQGKAPYAIGVDLARAQNFTAVCVVDSTGTLVHFERIRKTSWERIGAMVERIAQDYAPSTVYMDASRDNAVIEDVAKSGVHVERVRFTNKKKKELIENLAARLELKEIMISEEAEVLIDELTAFQYETTNAGNVRYTSPAGVHDDAVDALALASQRPKVQSGTW